MFFARPSSSLLSFSLCRSFRLSRRLGRTEETIKTITTTGSAVAHRTSDAVVVIIGGSSVGNASPPQVLGTLADYGRRRFGESVTIEEHATRQPRSSH